MEGCGRGILPLWAGLREMGGAQRGGRCLKRWAGLVAEWEGLREKGKGLKGPRPPFQFRERGGGSCDVKRKLVGHCDVTMGLLEVIMGIVTSQWRAL